MMKIVFMGTPQAAVPTLESILEAGHEVVAVWTQPDKPAGRGNKMHASPIKEFALSKNLPVFQPTKIKTTETFELFSSHRAELAVVVAYGRILPEAFLYTFPRGCVNVHFSLLPKYRGAAPVAWAIAIGETKTGVTTMKMDVGLDTGDILLQRETEIRETETSVELMSRLSLIGAELLIETLETFDSIIPQKQNNDEATFAPLLKKDDGKIDWNVPAKEIARRVRAFQAFPHSYTFLDDGQRLAVWSVTETHADFPSADTGSIVAATGNEFVVACGNSTFLRLDELQLAGKKRVDARAFLNGARIEVGQKFTKQKA